MHLRKKHLDGHDYLYAVDNVWNAGSPKVAFQTYLGRADSISGPHAKPLVKTFHYGSVAVLRQLARELNVTDIVNHNLTTQAPAASPSVGDYVLLAAINRAVKPRSKRAFAQWYENSSLKRLQPISPKLLTSQRFWDAMDQITPQACQTIFREIARQALSRFNIEDDVVAFDTTNFFTFIASDNQRPTMPQRGHSKAHRNDLRQVGLALAVTRRDQLPLFHHAYAGNQNDSTIFDALFPHLARDLSDLGQGQATWVYDKGNVSEATQRKLHDLAVNYVTSVPPTYYPELLAVPLAEMAEADARKYPALTDYRLLASQRQRWGRHLQMVMSYSPELAKGQLQGVLLHRDKATHRLQDLQAALARRHTKSRGRKPTLASVERQVERILSPQHMRKLLLTELYLEENDLVRLRFHADEAHLEHLQEHLFGRRVWLTTHLDWSPEQVVETAHHQAAVEADFRQLHSPFHVAWQPMYHWTDQKIRVHGLYCLIALLLVQLLRMLARRAGDERSVDHIIDDLDEVQECLVVPTLHEPGQTPRLQTNLNVTSPAQRKLMLSAGVPASALG
jgi:transposase